MIRVISRLLPVMLFASVLDAQERIEMQGTSVRGNRELPKVLYIVPWKSPQPVELGRPSFNSILDQSLQPLERSSFKRQAEYFELLFPEQKPAEQP